MNALHWLVSLRPALPMSIEQPCKAMSNGELRRHMQQGGVLVNGQRVAPDHNIEPNAVASLVFFPKSAQRRTTLF